MKAPSFADNLGNLLILVLISSESETELANLARRLSLDELVNRLMPLFSGENVKISVHSLLGSLTGKKRTQHQFAMSVPNAALALVFVIAKLVISQGSQYVAVF